MGVNYNLIEMGKIFHIVYQTINTINNKIYIGVHQTATLDFDGYLGNDCWVNKPSSYKNPITLFQKAVKKYGVSAFKRSTLKVFENRQDALDLERWLVDEEFIKRLDTYNMVLGGKEIVPTNSNKIFVYDKSGNFIKEFESQQKAAIFIYGRASGGSNISTALKKYGICKEYQVSRIKVDFMKDYITYKNTLWYNMIKNFKNKEGKESNFGNPIQIGQYDKNGKLIKIYKSIGECKRNGFTNVQAVLEGKRNHCKGFIFKKI